MLKAGSTEQLRVQIDFLINYSQMYGALAQYQARRAITKQLANVRATLVELGRELVKERPSVDPRTWGPLFLNDRKCSPPIPMSQMCQDRTCGHRALNAMTMSASRMHRLRREVGLQPGALLHYRISCRLREPASEVEVGSPGRFMQAVVRTNGSGVGQSAEFRVSMNLTSKVSSSLTSSTTHA